MSTRNPKIFDYAKTPELETLLEQVNKIDTLETTIETFDTASTDASTASLATVTEAMASYTTAQTSSKSTVAGYITALTEYSTSNLLNPNVDSSGSGSGGGTTVVTTKLITDKTLADIYINNSIMYVATKNYGFAYGALPGTGDFTFYSTSYTGLSLYTNSLYYSSDLAKLLLCSYDGLVIIDPSSITSDPTVKKITDGLPSNYITSAIVYNRSGTIIIIIGTSKGLSYSESNAVTFGDYDSTQLLVNTKITCLCIVGSTLIIGTTSGCYTKDLTNDSSTITACTTINSTLVNKYINDILYDSLNDILYVATNSGIIIWSQYSVSGSTANIKNSYNGLSSSICYSLALCSSTIYIATDNGITYSKDFCTTFKYITTSTGLSGYVCEKLFMDATNKKLTVLHAQGITVQLDISAI
jgi:hypothetical protein